MTSLSDMQLARELERQSVQLEALAGYRVEPNLDRGREFIERTGIVDVNPIVELMADWRQSKDVEKWGEAFSAMFWIMSDEQVAEFLILDTILGRVFDRLHDRFDPYRGQPAKLAAILCGIVEMTGAAISDFSRSTGYTPAVDSGSLKWATRHELKLHSDAGPQEEREAYEQAAFHEYERKAFDYHFAETLPPLGMWFTAATIASDLMDRYGSRDGISAIDTAADIVGWAGDWF